MRSARRLFVLATATGLLGLLVSPTAAAGDDYPYRSSTTNANDRWGFTQRQCVSFVAWRESQARHSLNNATQHWGDALHWDENAARLGFRVSTRPVVGAIAQWNAGERSPWWAYGSPTPNGTLTAGPYGHVGWVKQVNPDGSVVVEQYNITGTRSYSASRLKAPRYLYYGVG